MSVSQEAGSRQQVVNEWLDRTLDNGDDEVRQAVGYFEVGVGVGERFTSPHARMTMRPGNIIKESGGASFESLLWAAEMRLEGV